MLADVYIFPHLKLSVGREVILYGSSYVADYVLFFTIAFISVAFSGISVTVCGLIFSLEISIAGC